MPAEQRLTWGRCLFAFVVASVGAAAAAAISFAMTVYDAANPKPVPVAALGQPIDTGRWTITFRDARTGSIPPTGIKPSTPKNLVMVEFDLDNRSASTSNVFHRLFSIEPPVANLPPPAFYLARDKSVAGGLQPDMPERMIAAWEWPPAVPVAQQRRPKVTSGNHRRRDNLYGAPGWFERDPVAVVPPPVGSSP